MIMLFLAVTAVTQVKAAEKGSEVKISWEEFKKLLNLDADEVSLTWTEFQQLLAQTGEEGKIPYTLKNGKVILPRAQFKQLLDKMKPPHLITIKPPADYIITKAEYRGQMDAKNTTITASFFLEVFEKEKAGYRSIPFLPQSVALEEVLLDGQPALVMERGGWYHIATSAGGIHRLNVKYYAPSNLEKGPQILNLYIPKTAITLFNLSIPGEKVDIEVPNAKELQINRQNGQTQINAVLPATHSISVLAHRKYTPTETVKEEIPAKIYAETFNLLSIEDDALRVNSRFKLNVLQNKITHIEARIPDGYSILYITKQDGSRIRDWKAKDTESGRVVHIPFDTAVEGSVVFNILSERLFETEKVEIDFDGFQVTGAIRETGFVGAEKKSTAEAGPDKVEKLDRIDIKDLPFELIGMSQRPLLFGFRYLRHPFNLVMTVTKHKELPGISTVIDMASVITVFLEDGKTLTKAVYTIRNTWKQFLQLELPPDSEIWTVYVAGKRENASKSENGNILIPLIRSQMKQNVLQSFTVDLIYYGKGNPMRAAGRAAAHFPKADILISKMLWSVYLPQDFRYLRFAGNVEKEEMAKTFNLILGKSRDFSLDQVEKYNIAADNIEKNIAYGEKMTDEELKLQSVFGNQAIRRQDIAVQMRNEAGLEQIIQQEKSRGIGRPGSSSEILKIELPTSGRIYRFNKTVIEGEPISLGIYYTSNTIVTLIKILLILLLVLIIYLLRKKLFDLFKKTYNWIRTREKLRAFINSKTGLRVVLFFAALFFFFFSHVLFVIVTLLLLVALFRPSWLLPHKFPRVKKPVKKAAGETVKKSVTGKETGDKESGKKNDKKTVKKTSVKKTKSKGTE